MVAVRAHDLLPSKFFRAKSKSKNANKNDQSYSSSFRTRMYLVS